MSNSKLAKAHKGVFALTHLNNENIGLRSQILGIIATSKPEQEKINEILVVIRNFECSVVPKIERRVNQLQLFDGSLKI